MIRSLGPVASGIAMMLALGGGLPTGGQQVAHNTAVTTAQSEVGFPGKAELIRDIALYEDAERSAERTHPGMQGMLKIYSNLAALYEDAGMYVQSEDQMRREIAMLRSGPPDELAEAIGHLAVLHIAMGDLREAEKNELEALRVREGAGDPVGTALTWNDLAEVYIKEKQFKKALEYAEKATSVLADNPKVDVADRIAVRQSLGLALCGLKQRGQAIQILTDALQLEKTNYGADSLFVGAGNFLLGYTYWQNGDMNQAAELMAQGIARMKVDLGWGHVIYLNAVRLYAQFLRQSGQTEQAEAAEREIKMVNAVVDARSLAPTVSAFAAPGSR